MARVPLSLLACTLSLLLTAPSRAQTAPQTGVQTGVQTGIQPYPALSGKQTSDANGHVLIPMKPTTLPPGTLQLLKLEGEFSDAVLKGGGPAFASYFADDGVTLSNGKPAVQGKLNIAASATWDPKDYQLSWYALGAQMAPSNDSGFTWGHYDAVTKDKNGLPKTTGGRYFTFWKKIDGKWKVALVASSEEPTNGDFPIPTNIPQP